MNKLKILITLLISLIFYYGCQKDEARENSAHLTSRTSNPTVINGMLHFESFTDFEAFQEALKIQERDANAVNAAYTFLGVNLNDDDIPNLTDHPICLKTEMEISNYISRRKIEEDQINSILSSGGDIFSIVSNPYLKTVLNANMSVHIGTRIYKFFENGGLAIIFNNDWNLFNCISNSSFESLHTGYNIAISSTYRDDWDNYFTFNNDHTLVSEKETYLPRFYTTISANNSLQVHNISIIESFNGPITFTWLYSDNTTSIGVNPNRELAPNESISLTITRGGGRIETIPSELILIACPVIVITNLSNNQVRFEDTNFDPNRNNIYMRWVFSDGTISSNNINPFTRTCTGDGTVTCEYRYINSNEIACSRSLPYFCKCGEGKNIFSEKSQSISGRSYKIEVELSAQGTEVFARTKAYRKTAGIWFLTKKYDKLGAGLHGQYKVQNSVSGPCIQKSIDYSTEIDGGNYNIFKLYQDEKPNNVLRIPNALSSSHWLTKDGVTFGFGVNGSPRLVLN